MLRWLALLACAACVDCLKRVTLVTGANRGIGKEIARQLGSVPDQMVVLACRNEASGYAAMDELRASGCDCVFSRLDLTDWNSICETRAFIESQFGRLDALVNNAAISYGTDGAMYGRIEYTPFPVRARRTIETNYYGTLCVTDVMLPLLRESNWSPRIVNVASSTGSLRGSTEIQDAINSPYLDVPMLTNLMYEFVESAEAGTHTPRWPNTPNICYDVSKMGVKALTRIHARDEPNIMVNSVCMHDLNACSSCAAAAASLTCVRAAHWQVDPGNCKTEQNNFMGSRSPVEGAATPAMLATSRIGAADNFVSGKHW